MKLPDETVMAYVDGELDAPSRAEVEAAMEADAEIRSQVQAQIELRARLRASFDPVLTEAVPDNLVQAVRQSPANPSGRITDLSNVRATKQEKLQARRRWSLPQLGAIAASLVIGVLIGQRVLRSSQDNVLGTREGQLVASGRLDQALTQQLASNQPDAAPVQIGLTYRNESGAVCRTFVLSEGGAPAGVACRSNDAWRIEVLAQAKPTDAGTYRTAGSELPEAVRQAVQQGIKGEPLDADAERMARSNEWR